MIAEDTAAPIDIAFLEDLSASFPEKRPPIRAEGRMRLGTGQGL